MPTIAPPSAHLASLESRIAPLRARLATHPLYASLRTLDDLHRFMEAHVFAVWDFMSLLKSLQRGLTSVEVPWLPSEQPEARRLINEIVLGEESDVFEGRAVSHFELYLEAMRECGADTAPIERLLAALGSGARLQESIGAIPPAPRSFVEDTFTLIDERKLHVIAAAFTFGREDLIPDLFRGFLRDLNHQLDGRLSTFLWYLERHIEVDGEDHGPMALRMVSELCGEDEKRWEEAREAAEFALRSRLRLWDALASSPTSHHP
jgi:hypothetical protein